MSPVDSERGQAELTAPAETAGAPSRPARSRLSRLLRGAFLVVVLGLIVYALWKERSEVLHALRTVSPLTILASLGAGIVGTALPGVVWRDLLLAQGHHVRPAGGARTFFLGQLGKYVPGGIWTMVAQVDLARDLRVPARPAATASLLSLALSVLSALIVAGLTLPIALPGLVAGYWWVFAVVPVLLALLHPRVVAWWSATAFRLVRRPAPAVQLGWGVMIRAVLVLVVSWLALGVQFGVLVNSQRTAGPSLWLLSVGVFALAWVAGFLVIVAPAGAGVREGALVLGLAAALPGGTVLAMALLSRVVLMGADVVLAAVAVLVARLRPHADSRPTGD
jgi:glycosyltransferase 2 family protein